MFGYARAENAEHTESNGVNILAPHLKQQDPLNQWF